MEKLIGFSMETVVESAAPLKVLHLFEKLVYQDFGKMR